MAIQNRRGTSKDFDASKMLPGEFAVTTDGSRKAYVAFQANDVKELAFKEDIKVTAEKIKEALGYTPADQEDITELNENLSESIIEISSDIYADRIRLTSGYIVTSGTSVDITNIIPSATFECITLECIEGDMFILNGFGGSDERLWAFVDSSYTIIHKAVATASASNYKLSAPPNTKYLIVNMYNGGRLQKVNNYLVNKDITSKVVDAIRTTTMPMLADIIGEFKNCDYKTVSQSLEYTNDRITTSNIFDVGDDLTIDIMSGYNFIVYYYQQNGAYINNSGWKSTEYTIPSNCHCRIGIRKDNNSSIFTVEALCLYQKTFKTIESQINKVNEELKSFDSKFYDKCEDFIVPDDSTLIPATILSNGTWSVQPIADLSRNSMYVFDYDENRYHDGTLKIESGTYDTYISFVRDIDYVEGKKVTFASNETGRHTIPPKTVVTLDIPNDTKYIVFTKHASYVLYRPLKLNLSANALLGRIKQTRKLYRDMPKNRAVLNSYKRAHQLLDLRWNALSTVPTTTNAIELSAGNHVGVVYSSVKECDKYVGWNVSIETFMTAVHNPYSLLYTEDVNESRSKSAYGKTYHGVNCGAYFGIVCNTFALYTIGMPIPWNTSEWASLEKQGILEKVYDQSAYGIELMDIIWEPRHGNVITDIYRDDRGNPVEIHWSESTNPIPITTAMTVDEFNARLARLGGVIYRYKDLYKSIDYVKSEFVDVENEYTITPYNYNDDICTFAGNKACFRTGEDIYINYNAGVYNKIQLFKNEELINTFDIVDTNAHTYKLPDLSHGMYSARLTNGSRNSDYTYFEIVDTTVSATISGDDITVIYSSQNGTPQYVQQVLHNGDSRGIVPVDKNSNQITYNAYETLYNQYNTRIFDGDLYIKVFFEGQYGVVTNDPILVINYNN